MAHAGERLELERAFSGATVHDSSLFGKQVIRLATLSTLTARVEDFFSRLMSS